MGVVANIFYLDKGYDVKEIATYSKFFGVFATIIGGIIGVIMGTSILYLFASLNEWPFAMPVSAMIGSISFSAMVGLFFGIWPARKAANLDPATSLRYE